MNTWMMDVSMFLLLLCLRVAINDKFFEPHDHASPGRDDWQYTNDYLTSTIAVSCEVAL
jgi:hypothetical protein